MCAGRGKLHTFCHADRERVFHKNSVRATRDDRYDALVQKDRSHRLSIRFLMFDSCLLFVSPDSDLCVCVYFRILFCSILICVCACS